MILLIGHDASLTGAPKMLLALAQWLRYVKKERLQIILKSPGPLLAKYKEIAPVFVWYPEDLKESRRKRIRPVLAFADRVRKRWFLMNLKRSGGQVIFNNTIINGDILEALRFLNIPVVSRIPELESVIRIFNTKGNADKTFRYSDILIAVSGAVKTNLIENHGIPGEKIRVVHNGLPENIRDQKPALSRSDLGIPKNAFVAGACGTLLARKGTDLFISLADELINRQNQKDLFFIWVGGDQQGEFFRQFNETIKKLGLEQHVIITGETTDPGVYYPLMNVFCMTSREEPFGLVMLEAGSCGVPVVCFEKSGFPPEFTTPDVGFAIPHENIIAMAAKIVLLKNNPELHMEFSKNILKKVSTYTFDSMAEKVYAAIQQTRK